MKSILLVALAALALLGCSDPKEKFVPTDKAKWETELKPSIEKLAEEDKKLFLGFVMRAHSSEASGGGKGLEEGLTIGKAIEQQRAWVAERERKKAEAELSQQKLQAERVAMSKQVEDELTVTVLRTQLLKVSNFENQIIEFGFRNRGQKDILGIKGTVRFFDNFDKEICSVSFNYMDGVKSGAYSTWKSSRHYNPLIESHKAVANLEEGKYKTRFDPEMIEFTDGTKFVIKD